jgi:hypothetical protein
MKGMLPSILVLALLASPAVALAGGAVIVRADTLERGALDPWVTLADGSLLDLRLVDLHLSATAHEPRFLVIGGVTSGRTRELPASANVVQFESRDGTQQSLTAWIAPHGSLAYWPGANAAAHPADADILIVVRPGGESFEIRRPSPTPVPEPAGTLLIAAGAVFLSILRVRSARPMTARPLLLLLVVSLDLVTRS